MRRFSHIDCSLSNLAQLPRDFTKLSGDPVAIESTPRDYHAKFILYFAPKFPQRWIVGTNRYARDPRFFRHSD